MNLKKASFLLLILPVLTVAQKVHSPESYANFGVPELKEEIFYPEQVYLNESGEAAAQLANLLTLPEGFSLKLRKVYPSLASDHYRFTLLYNEREVFLGEYHFAVSKKSGAVSLASHPRIPFAIEETLAEGQSIPLPSNALSSNERLLRQKQVYFPQGSKLIPAVLIELTDENQAHLARAFTQNEWIYQHDLRQYHHAHGPNDTTIEAYVFNPDPLTSAFTSYAAPYIDGNDGMVPAIEAERVLKNVTVTKDNAGSLLFENDACVLQDFAPPFSGVTQAGQQQNYLFSRSEGGFEDMNVLYHLHQQFLHLQALGFTNYPGYRVPIDPHGASGADNSFFSFISTPPTIEFGEGGVDDAEDADVIVHEYNHALQFSFTGTSPVGNERKTIEEGLADYFTVSYSKSINPFNADKVFSWDGHNEFWPGREGSSTKNYKDLNFTPAFYQHTDFVAAVMGEIMDSLDRNTADQLIWEAMFGLGANTNMPQFAAMVLQADVDLNAGVHFQLIKRIFVRRGILSDTFDLKEVRDPLRARVYAMEAFSKGGKARFTMPEAGTVELYDLSGKRLQSWKYTLAHEVMEIDGAQLKPGVYILKASNSKGSKTESYKLIRL